MNRRSNAALSSSKQTLLKPRPVDAQKTKIGESNILSNPRGGGEITNRRTSFLASEKKAVQNAKVGARVATSSSASAAIAAKQRKTSVVQRTYEKTKAVEPKASNVGYKDQSTLRAERKLNEMKSTVAVALAKRSSILAMGGASTKQQSDKIKSQGTTNVADSVQPSQIASAITTRNSKTSSMTDRVKNKIKLAFNINSKGTSGIARYWSKHSSPVLIENTSQETSSRMVLDPPQVVSHETELQLSSKKSPQHLQVVSNNGDSLVQHKGIIEPVVSDKEATSNPEKIVRADPAEEARKRQQDIIRKREDRQIAAREKREKLEQQRMESALASSWTRRLDKVHERAIEKRRIQQWLIYTVYISRLLMWQEAIDDYRIRQKKARLEYTSAEKIANAMQRNYVVSCRRRALKAFNIISVKLLLKIVEWRRKRRCHACEIILSFLGALAHENSITHGCLSMMAKGKQWIAYKKKVIKLQCFWRREKLHIDAQAYLLDLQWQQEHERLLRLDVDKLYTIDALEFESLAKMMNAANQTRKVINMKPLMIRKPPSKETVRKRLLDELGNDILTVHGIVALEIRLAILRESLCYMKYLYVISLGKFVVHQLEPIFKKAPVSGASTIASITKGIALRHGLPATAMEDNTRQERLHQGASTHKLATNGVAVCSKRPRFSILLGHQTLERIIQLAHAYVNKVRNAWSPKVIDFTLPEYREIGREVGKMHHLDRNGGSMKDETQFLHPN